MALKTEERTIGSTRYRVTQLGFREGRDVLVRLTKLIGPSAAQLLDGVNLTGKAMLARVLASGNAGAAIAQFCERLDDAQLGHLARVFGAQTEVGMPDNKWPRLAEELQEIHFAGAYEQFFKWLAFCLEVNYAGFFAAASALSGGESEPKSQ